MLYLSFSIIVQAWGRILAADVSLAMDCDVVKCKKKNMVVDGELGPVSSLMTIKG